MRLYKEYLIKNLFKPLIISLVTLTLLIWSSRVVRYMDYIVQDGAGFLSFFKLTLFVLPSLILMILPLAVALTTILTYNKFIENREILILKNCGIKKIQLLNPLIILSIVISIFSYSISLYGSYKSNLEIRKIRENIQNNLSFSMIKDGVFSKFKNLVIYADKKDGNKAYNILIYDDKKTKNGNNMLLQSEYAEINQNIIKLFNGNFQIFSSDYDKSPEILFFNEYDINFNELSGEQNNLTIKLDSRPTTDLFKMLLNHEQYLSQFSKKNLIYEINYRLGFPLVSIIIALLSGSLMLEGSFNRVSTFKIVSKTGITSIITFIIFLLLFQKVESNLIYLYILYLFMAIILYFSLHLIGEKNKK